MHSVIDRPCTPLKDCTLLSPQVAANFSRLLASALMALACTMSSPTNILTVWMLHTPLVWMLASKHLVLKLLVSPPCGITQHNSPTHTSHTQSATHRSNVPHPLSQQLTLSSNRRTCLGGFPLHWIYQASSVRGRRSWGTSWTGDIEVDVVAQHGRKYLRRSYCERPDERGRSSPETNSKSHRITSASEMTYIVSRGALNSTHSLASYHYVASNAILSPIKCSFVVKH